MPVTLPAGPTTKRQDPGAIECAEFLRLLEAVLARFRPDVLIAAACGDRLLRAVLERARPAGIATVCWLRDLRHDDPAACALADTVLVASRFAADYYHEALGLSCTVLPPLVDPDRVRAERTGSGYVTFVDPTPEHGVWAFARIADELGRRRPDIPLLVVEGRGTEATLVACGLDLRAHGNVHLMARTPAPRRYWGETRVGLLPALDPERCLTWAVEALVNGVPVVTSDRGSLPEVLGAAGSVLPLPDRLTPATEALPTAEEVVPWIEAIIRLWDDGELSAAQRRRAAEEARRWAPEAVAPRLVQLLNDLRPVPKPPAPRPPRRARAVVLVPHLNGIDWECEQPLRRLERAGVRVVRRGGSSAVDAARNQLISDALHDGFEAMLFIDADIGFDPVDALRLLARPEPVVAGVYAKKGHRKLASQFAAGIHEVRFGPEAPGLYPLHYAAAGFLRIRADVLRRMIEQLELPLCNTRWGRGAWPFFLPLVVSEEEGRSHYLGEDWAFSHRLGSIGVTPLADTTIRLWHWGRYGYGWEDAGATVKRQRSYRHRLRGR